MHVISSLLLFTGILFFFGGAVGIIRFPDFYTRLHPAGKLDTAGLLFSMSGMALFTMHEFSAASVLTSMKIMLIVVFVFITSPTATHAIIDAGFSAGLRPWTQPDKEIDVEGEP